MRRLPAFALLSVLGCGQPPTTTVASQVFGPAKVTLDNLPEAKARELNGRQVVTTMTVATPYFTLNGNTILGPAEHPDGVERSVVLFGERPDTGEGKRISVTGRLWVFDHPPARIGAAFVPAWREIRVVEDPPKGQ